MKTSRLKKLIKKKRKDIKELKKELKRNKCSHGYITGDSAIEVTSVLFSECRICGKIFYYR